MNYQIPSLHSDHGYDTKYTVWLVILVDKQPVDKDKKKSKTAICNNDIVCMQFAMYFISGQFTGPKGQNKVNEESLKKNVRIIMEL